MLPSSLHGAFTQPFLGLNSDCNTLPSLYFHCNSLTFLSFSPHGPFPPGPSQALIPIIAILSSPGLLPYVSLQCSLPPFSCQFYCNGHSPFPPSVSSILIPLQYLHIQASNCDHCNSPSPGAAPFCFVATLTSPLSSSILLQ